ncbi:DUF58 domain-containing protein [Demequina sp. NBRC 110053]|uniref:DUF58 domain-containing protein n=1 Tax=Demequina sp. NBRC 110053 TaxID=1570342 RepID=UPI001F459350|nr:DUF58 domain-containing protein [Demequina sp. NBRC 110053]
MTGTRTRGVTVTRYATERTGMSARVEAGRRAAGRVGAAVARAWSATAETINPAGWLLVAVAAGGFAAAFAWGWAEAWVVAVAATALLVLCIPFLLGRHSYEVALEFDRDRVVAGTDLVAALGVRNVGQRVSLPALLDIPVGEGLIEAHVPLLRAGHDHRETLTIAAERRGVIAVGPMTIGRGDPVGVLQRDHTWPDVQHIYVHPATVPIPSTSAGLLRDLEGVVTSTIVDSDLAFHAIRDYRPGDSRRHVHWKSTAKTGQLMVRQYEETRRSRIAIAIDLDVSQYQHEDEFEMAVSAASSLGLQAIRDGREVVITASAEIPRHAVERVHSLRTLPTLTPTAMLDGMSGIDGTEDVMPLPLVAGMTAQEAEHLSMVFLVTGSRQPLPSLRKAAVAFSADVTVVAVRADAGAEPAVRSARELTVLTIGMLHDLGHLMLRGSV